MCLLFYRVVCDRAVVETCYKRLGSKRLKINKNSKIIVRGVDRQVEIVHPR